jgi:hypothetical protein
MGKGLIKKIIILMCITLFFTGTSIIPSFFICSGYKNDELFLKGINNDIINKNLNSGFDSRANNYSIVQFFFGRINDLLKDEHQTSFIAINLWLIGYENSNGTISSYILHTKSETKRFYLSSEYEFRGVLTFRFICGIFQIKPGIPSNTTLSMDIFSRNDDLNEIVWLVTGIEGAALESSNWMWALLRNTGENDTNATCKFYDHDNNDYVTAGDMFTVTAGSDGNYTLILTEKRSGRTLFKSPQTKY